MSQWLVGTALSWQQAVRVRVSNFLNTENNDCMVCEFKQIANSGSWMFIIFISITHSEQDALLNWRQNCETTNNRQIYKWIRPPFHPVPYPIDFYSASRHCYCYLQLPSMSSNPSQLDFMHINWMVFYYCELLMASKGNCHFARTDAHKVLF